MHSSPHQHTPFTPRCLSVAFIIIHNQLFEYFHPLFILTGKIRWFFVNSSDAPGHTHGTSPYCHGVNVHGVLVSAGKLSSVSESQPLVFVQTYYVYYTNDASVFPAAFYCRHHLILLTVTLVDKLFCRYTIALYFFF